MTGLFYISSAVAVVATILFITRLNVVHALLYLVVSLLSVALVFFSLGAHFAAALEVIVYAGAIMILFIFVVMMLNLGPLAAKEERQLLSPGIWRGPALLALVLLAELVFLFMAAGGPSYSVKVVGPKQVAIVLLGPYLLGVELASILLLAGLVGTYHLGRRAVGKERFGGER